MPNAKERPAHGAYRPDIDGLRAIAVVSVLIFHAFPTWLPGGFTGVDVFFVISGYLISGILLKEIAAGRFTFRGFYVRRIRRIFPALLVVLTSCVVAGWFVLLHDELNQLSAHVAYGALSLANVRFWREAGYFDTAGDLKPLLHLWSLGVEEQYYLVWPVLLVLAHGRIRRVGTAMMAAIALSFIFNVTTIRIWPTAAFYLLPARLWELGLGSFLAFLAFLQRAETATRSRAHLWLKDGVAAVGIVLLLSADLLLDRRTPFPGWSALLPTVGTALLISSGPQAWVNRLVLSAGPVVQLGLISYPLYLWHWPLLSFGRILNPKGLSDAEAATLLGVATVLAWLTYRFIETPIRRSPRGAPIVGWLLAGTAVLTTMSLALRADFLPQRRHDGEELVRAGKALDRSIREAYGAVACDGVIELAPLVRGHSTVTPEVGNPPTFVMWGDSHATAWSPALFDLGRKKGYRVVVIAHDGCAPLLGVRDSGGTLDEAHCQPGLAQDVLRTIAALKPVHVFYAARWSLYTHGWRVHGRLQDRTHYLTTSPDGAADEASSRAAIAAQFEPTVQAILKLAPVTLFKSVPTLASAVEEGRIGALQRFEPTIDEHRALHSLDDALIDEAAVGQSGVSVFDPARFLCRAKCASVLDDTLLYKDDNHLTAQAARLFEDQLAPFLAGEPGTSPVLTMLTWPRDMR